jgi:hypothetical protein
LVARHRPIGRRLRLQARASTGSSNRCRSCLRRSVGYGSCQVLFDYVPHIGANLR